MPRLGVAHRRRVIAVDIAEIALPVDQRIALRELLREPHQRVVDRPIAVRMVFADDVADDARGLLERRPGSSRNCRMANSSRRCTGLSPSRASGSARCMMVDSA